MKIRCTNAADRDSLVVILARNGYTVRQGKCKLSPGGRKGNIIRGDFGKGGRYHSC